MRPQCLKISFVRENTVCASARNLTIVFWCFIFCDSDTSQTRSAKRNWVILTIRSFRKQFYRHFFVSIVRLLDPKFCRLFLFFSFYNLIVVTHSQRLHGKLPFWLKKTTLWQFTECIARNVWAGNVCVVARFRTKRVFYLADRWFWWCVASDFWPNAHYRRLNAVTIRSPIRIVGMQIGERFIFCACYLWNTVDCSNRFFWGQMICNLFAVGNLDFLVQRPTANRDIAYDIGRRRYAHRPHTTYTHLSDICCNIDG